MHPFRSAGGLVYLTTSVDDKPVIIIIIYSSGSVRFVRLLLGVVAKCSTSIALHTYYVWTMELYDTQLRASSLGLANIACRIGGASAPWITKGNNNNENNENNNNNNCNIFI